MHQLRRPKQDPRLRACLGTALLVATELVPRLISERLRIQPEGLATMVRGSLGDGTNRILRDREVLLSVELAASLSGNVYCDFFNRYRHDPDARDEAERLVRDMVDERYLPEEARAVLGSNYSVGH